MNKDKVIIQGIEYIHKQITTDGRLVSLELKIDDAIKNVKSASNEKDYKKALCKCRELFKLFELQKLLSGYQRDDPEPIYIFDTLFLWQSFRFLKRFDSEAIHFATGPEVDGNFYLTNILPVRMSHRNWVAAVGDLTHTHQLLQDLDGFGCRLTAYFHTHPGLGAFSTAPSGTDLSLQEALEKGGYPVIGGIFTFDGFLRFFSHNRKFEVKIYGKRVKKEGENLFRLVR